MTMAGTEMPVAVLVPLVMPLQVSQREAQDLVAGLAALQAATTLGQQAPTHRPLVLLVVLAAPFKGEKGELPRSV